jgi:F-type H+-transporting ATPase subunit b
VLINWFTVFAQILNFLILVGLLRWLLYKPILQVMAKRQEKLMAQWQDTEKIQEESAEALAVYQRQQREFEGQKSTLLAEAQASIHQERQRQLQQLQQEIIKQKEVWQGELEQEQKAVLQGLRQRIIQQTMAITKQSLTDLANGDLEEQMVLRFCEKLSQLDSEKREIINQALAQTEGAILLTTSFTMAPALHQQLQARFQTIFNVTQAIETEISPHLICGIELILAGQEIVWSLDSYLQGLEQNLVKL